LCPVKLELGPVNVKKFDDSQRASYKRYVKRGFPNRARLIPRFYYAYPELEIDYEEVVKLLLDELFYCLTFEKSTVNGKTFEIKDGRLYLGDKVAPTEIPTTGSSLEMYDVVGEFDSLIGGFRVESL
jgi:hypothetical protein